MEDLGKLYAAAHANTFNLPDGQSILLEQWRAFKTAGVWTRRLDHIYFFKAHEWQHRVTIPYRTFPPEEAVALSEQVAEDFARHGIKTDPAQILDAMADIVVKPEPLKELEVLWPAEDKTRKRSRTK